MISVRSGAGGPGARTTAGPLARPGVRARPPALDAVPDPDIGVLALADAAGTVARTAARSDAIAPFTSLIGVRAAAANPVWGPDALALLRALQKRMIAQALLVDQPARRPLLDAVAVLEQAVTMRLRMLQMQHAHVDGVDAEPAPARRSMMTQLFEQPGALPVHAAVASEPEESAAIGLAWGLLATRQFYAADRLVRGSLAVWPQQALLHLLGAYAAGETGQAVAPAVPGLLRQSRYGALASLILRRAAPATTGSTSA